MTNAMIILNESVKLMESGVIKGTGQFVEVEDADGNKKRLEIPEEIHTFAAWKSMGYSVKKGEHAVAKFAIWKHTAKMLDTNTGNAETDKMNAEINDKGGMQNMFMKVAAFFTADQVEKIGASVGV